MAQTQMVALIVAAIITFLGTGGAAFLGARVALRNANVTDARAKETTEWERLQWVATMACSTNSTEAYVGVYLLGKSKETWNSNAEQRAFIRRTLEALTDPAVQAYRGGQTKFVTGPPPEEPPDAPPDSPPDAPPDAPPSSPPQPGGAS